MWGLMQGDTRMLTASGDQSLALWDTLSARRVSTFHGHGGSVKSVCPMPACHDVFASGAQPPTPPFLQAAPLFSLAGLGSAVPMPLSATPPHAYCLPAHENHPRHGPCLVQNIQPCRCSAGARDGAVLLWDARLPSTTGLRSCVLKVQVRRLLLNIILNMCWSLAGFPVQRHIRHMSFHARSCEVRGCTSMDCVIHVKR